LGQTPIEALHHAVGLRRLGLGQPVLNAQGLAQLIKLMLSGGLTTAAAKQAVGELFAVVREDGADFEVRRLAQCRQEGFRRSCCLVLLDGNEHPTGGSVDARYATSGGCASCG
jgi:hypothetical protein